MANSDGGQGASEFKEFKEFNEFKECAESFPFSAFRFPFSVSLALV